MELYHKNKQKVVKGISRSLAVVLGLLGVTIVISLFLSIFLDELGFSTSEEIAGSVGYIIGYLATLALFAWIFKKLTMYLWNFSTQKIK